MQINLICQNLFVLLTICKWASYRFRFGSESVENISDPGKHEDYSDPDQQQQQKNCRRSHAEYFVTRHKHYNSHCSIVFFYPHDRNYFQWHDRHYFYPHDRHYSNCTLMIDTIFIDSSGCSFLTTRSIPIRSGFTYSR